MRVIFILLLMFFFVNVIISADFYAFQSGNYTSSSIWRIGSCSGTLAGTTPGATDNVYICSGVTVTVSSNITCANMFIWGSFQISGNRNITVSNNLTMYNGSILGGDNNNANLYVNGNFNFNNGAIINGLNPFNLRITGNLYNIADGTSDWAQVGRVDIWVNGMSYIDGNFIFTITGQGTKRFNGGLTINSSGTFDNTVGEDPFINGDIINDGNWIGCTGGNCIYTLGNIAGRTINITGANPVPLSAISIGNVSSIINNYTTIILDRSANAGTLLRNTGTFNNYGILYVGRGAEINPIENTIIFNASYPGNTVCFQRNGDQQVRIPNDGKYYNLVIASLGKKYLQTIGGTLTVINTLTIKDDATLWIGSSETLNGTASLTMTGNSILQIDKCSPAQPELTGNYNLMDNSTIKLTGNCNQTYNTTPTGSNSLANLVLGGSGSKNISGINTINGNLEITGSATLGAHSTFDMDCNYTFKYSSSGTSTLTNNINIGNFEQTNGTINTGGYTIFVCGSYWKTDGGTFNPGTGTVNFQNATSVEGIVTPVFNHVIVNGGAKLYAHTTIMNVKGNFTNDGMFYHRNGTIAFDGNSSILGLSTTTFNNLTITANGTLTSHSDKIYVEGDFTNNKTFNHNNGTVIFSRDNSSTISGSTVTTSFYNIVIDKNNAASVITQLLATVDIINSFKVINGIYNVGTNTLRGGGSLIMLGGELQIAKLSTTVPELTGTYTITGGTVTLNGAGPQTLRTNTIGGDTYCNLIFTNSGNKVITGLLNINGDVTVSGSAFISGVSAFTQNPDKTFYYLSSGTSTIGSSINIGSFYQNNGTITINTNLTLNVKGASFEKYNSGKITLNGTARLIFNGSDTQYFTDNSTNPTYTNVTVDNTSGLVLNSDIQISTNLNLRNGLITTQSNRVFMNNSSHTITRTNGFINGWLECVLPTGTITPVIVDVNVSASGNIRIGAFENDHPDIFASNIDPNKTVNVHWKIPVNTITSSGSFNLTFQYPSTLVDIEAFPDEFQIGKYNVPDFTLIVPTPIPSYTSTSVLSLPDIIGDYIIGNKYNPDFMYNAATGTIYWSDKSNWIKYRTGVISCNTSSNIVTGISTKFVSELNVGDQLTYQSNPQFVIGEVQSIIDDNTMLLTTNAATNLTNVSYGIKKLPEINDIVNIGNPLVNTANVDLILDIDAEIHQLNFTAMARSNSLTHQDGKYLFVRTNANILVPSSATNNNTWNINNGSTTIQGNLIIGRGGTTNRRATMNIINGLVEVGTNLVFNSNNPATSATLNITGTGRINLGGSFILTNTGTNYGTFNPGTDGIFCYCSSNNPQTANFTNTIPAVNYAHLYFGNTSSSGATIPASITATRVKGNLVVESGLFYYGSNFASTGNTGKQFIVKNGATFRLLNTATFPTVYTYNLEPGSIVEVKTTTSTNMPVVSYGYLKVIPEANGAAPRFNASGNVQILNDLIVGNGINTTTLDLYSFDPNLTIYGKVYINSNATLGFSDLARNIELYGNWINNGGSVNNNITQSTVRFLGSNEQEITGTVTSQNFPNIEINKTSGSVKVTGAITTLNTNAITITSGEFNAPAFLNLVNSTSAHLTIGTSGILNDNNTQINIYGNWINNGGLFNYGNSKVIFNSTATQYIQGSLTIQEFNDLEINKTNGNVIQSINQLSVNNYVQRNRTFQAQTAGSTFIVRGNFELTGNSNFNGTNITNLHIRGNITHNSTGTWTMSQNVFLNGNTQQIISGMSNIPAFIKLTIDNSYINDAILASKSLIITNTLTLTRGQILAVNPVEITASGTIMLNAPGGDQSLSFVKGSLIHNVNTITTETKIFPVGDDNIYHRIDLIIRQTTTLNTKYTGKYINSSASALGWTLPPSIICVSNIGHWEITKGVGANVATAAVTLHFDPTYDEVTDLSTLHIAKENTSSWLDIGGSVSGNTITSTINFTTFSKFALASTAINTNPLPINLVSFKGECRKNNIILQWTTSSEVNNDYFELERSENGYEYYKIAKIDGSGTSNSWIDYSYLDSTAKFVSYPFLYYKLKQVDFDQKYTYSEPISVSKCPENTFSTFDFVRVGYSENYILLLFSSSLNDVENIQVELIDKSGRMVFTNEYPKVHNTIYIPKNNLATGAYSVVVKYNDKVITKKVVVMK